MTTDSSIGRISELTLRTPDGPVRVAAYESTVKATWRASPTPRGPSSLRYDANGRITSWTDRNDSTYQYVYDTAGRVLRTIGPDGFLPSALAGYIFQQSLTYPGRLLLDAAQGDTFYSLAVRAEPGALHAEPVGLEMNPSPA
ncbi:RHS repeat domain-containing protein [Streptomyces sp. NPDC056844]|uniref:RHS repeat domain-containing protein n=1 Tax=unclassified Streptomyces TaxID=2593676 RepID=UPI0036BBAD72